MHGRDGGDLGGVRRFALIHTGRETNHWLIHRMDGKSTSRNKRPEKAKQTAADAFVAPMLATLARESEIDDESDWSFEMKWDGMRAVAVVTGEGVELFSRNGRDISKEYPELIEELPKAVRGTAVLDGEIVALNSKGAPDFGHLQLRMGLSDADEINKAIRTTPVHLMLFDLLEYEGRSLMKDKYADRRESLVEAVLSPKRGRIQVPPAFDGRLADAVRASEKLRLEGVVAKKVDSRYRSGRRSQSWLKIKHQMSQEVIIGGWRPGRGARSGSVGSLLMGITDAKGDLQFVGRVGSGFSEVVLRDFDRRFRRHGRKMSPFADMPTNVSRDAQWITPSLVGEVEFGDWTADGRLRHPRWRGWRPDKEPGDVARENA